MFRKIYHGSESLAESVRRNLRERSSIFCRGQIPLWVKLLYTLFAATLLQIRWGVDLLWFCYVAALTTLVALWLESPLLVSMQALAVFWPMVLWQVDFLLRNTTGIPFLWADFTSGIFDPNIPLLIRAVDTNHVWFLYFLLWLVWRLGYDRRALLAQTLYCCMILLLSYTLTDPLAENINWIHGLWNGAPQRRMAPWLWVALLMGFFPAIWYFPLHCVFSEIFRPPKGTASSETVMVGGKPDRRRTRSAEGATSANGKAQPNDLVEGPELMSGGVQNLQSDT